VELVGEFIFVPYMKKIPHYVELVGEFIFAPYMKKMSHYVLNSRSKFRKIG
jgi:hypothetical protein